MSYFVYILQSVKDQKYYVGSTSDVEARLLFHNMQLQRSTRHRTPFIIVYIEELNNKSQALIREKEIKGYKGGNSFRKLLQK
ncbi:MAG: GIY-YIG nuclease family protein [Flavitalea sp.]